MAATVTAMRASVCLSENDKMERLHACVRKGWRKSRGSETADKRGEEELKGLSMITSHFSLLALVEKYIHESIRCEKMPGDATGIEII